MSDQKDEISASLALQLLRKPTSITGDDDV